MSIQKKPTSATASPLSVRTKAIAQLSGLHNLKEFASRLTAEQVAGITDRAQAMMYEAWEEGNPAKRIMMARRALVASPLCADAWSLLAREEANSPQDALELYKKGVEAGELAIGADFKDWVGFFWGVHETRPYMRARAGLAQTLWSLSQQDEAIAHLEAMLELNPGDNQGLRYILSSYLLKMNNLASLKALLKQHEDDATAFMLYTRALVAFMESSTTAKKLAKQAWKSNNHVPAILAGTTELVPVGSFIAMGGVDEASSYVTENGDAWRKVPGAIEWLVATTSPVSKTLKKARS